MNENRPLYYILDENGEPVPTEDMQALGRMFESDERIVKKEAIGGYLVSTVFLGIDHSCIGRPRLYETMIFSEEDPLCLGYQERYSTRKEALEGHEQAKQWLKEHLAKQKNSPEA